MYELAVGGPHVVIYVNYMYNINLRNDELDFILSTMDVTNIPQNICCLGGGQYLRTSFVTSCLHSGEA